MSVQEFYHDFRQGFMADAEANSSFQLESFVELVAQDLVEGNVMDGFEFCHFRAKGLRVDGYWLDEEGVLSLIIADFECRDELASLTKTDVNTIFKRVKNFFESSRNRSLYKNLDETTPEYGLSRQIADRKQHIRRVDFFLLSERTLSDKFKTYDEPDDTIVPMTYHIWDMSRLFRQQSSKGHKEPLDLDLIELFGTGVSCLPAHLGEDTFPSYLVVMPGEILSKLYAKHGARLLEQNVRTFLQARGNVNKGIRNTITNEPDMFFAYNNGITATAQSVNTELGSHGLQITRVKDLQIVNGGQTTASLFHTYNNNPKEVSLEKVFVQMKLSIIESEESETIVPLISEYANTQNKVSASDFFSNHPFHIRIEGFSRRKYVPAKEGEQRETKWFYERTRGQFADEQSKLKPSEKRRFQAEHPRNQMFTKTDLAKFENVWDEHPKWVCLGAQKNFTQFAKRIGKDWILSQDFFNEFFYQRLIARGIIFRRAEKLVSVQPWYDGGFRAQIVANALAMISEVCKRNKVAIDYMRIWNNQKVYPSLLEVITIATKMVSDDITHPPEGISNIGEWCKKEGCWTRLQSIIPKLESNISKVFWDETISIKDQAAQVKDAKETQKIDDGINAQKQVVEIPATTWATVLSAGIKGKFLSSKEANLLRIAQQIPMKIPSEKQCNLLIAILLKAEKEGVVLQ
ncbi:AIPR family protein [Maridesulfovibrio sp. FT414]|uniref:AIPR family protein n=1 Tax=Maridesulfovibrio sp. FT414 TaxID=2979469 RepID=UPI003D8060DD